MKRLFKIALVPLVCSLGWLEIPKALAQVPAVGRFRATNTCEATPAIRRPNNPGNIRLTNGRNYEVMGFNSSRREFIQIIIPEANPNLRWVNVSCGTFSEGSTATDPTPVTPSTGVAFLPFFDNENNPESGRAFPRTGATDITPPPPVLDDFDRAVLRTCGQFGANVTIAQLRGLFTDFPEVVAEVQEAVGGEIKRGRSSQAEFLDDLVEVWTAREGFEHIFCGENDGRDEIGGLHFVGRYWQLQETGRGGRLPNNRRREEVVEGEIYTLGVVVVDAEGRLLTMDDLKGYGYPSSAKNLLIDGTKAFKANGQGACLYNVTDPETGESFQAVFVRSDRGVITFYPDATPSGRACR